MAEPSPLPSPEQLAELVRRGAAIRREAERLVEDALRAITDNPALGPEAARDVAEYLARRPGKPPMRSTCHPERSEGARSSR